MFLYQPAAFCVMEDKVVGVDMGHVGLEVQVSHDLDHAARERHPEGIFDNVEALLVGPGALADEDMPASVEDVPAVKLGAEELLRLGEFSHIHELKVILGCQSSEHLLDAVHLTLPAGVPRVGQ